mgnify:CR=1 FL=1
MLVRAILKFIVMRNMQTMIYCLKEQSVKCTKTLYQSWKTRHVYERLGQSHTKLYTLETNDLSRAMFVYDALPANDQGDVVCFIGAVWRNG